MVADKPRPAANPLISEHQSQEAKWYQNGPALGGELKNPRAAMVERQEGDHAIDVGELRYHCIERSEQYLGDLMRTAKPYTFSR
jgi:hypothetical protein